MAVGQILAYHGEKTKYKTDIFNYDWNKISNKNLDHNYFKKYFGDSWYYYETTTRYTRTTAISDFLWNIADEVIWDDGKSYSIGSHQRAAYYFLDSGYDVSGGNFWTYFKWSHYNRTTVINEIYHNRPVYLSGWSGIFGAHAWVADGYIKVYIESKSKIIKGQYIDRYGWNYIKGYESTSYTYTSFASWYIHMNWGWGYGSWCTYNYWVTLPNDKGETKHYKYLKGMITVKHRK